MASALYQKWKEAVIQASSNSSLAGTLNVAAVDTGTYTFSQTHDFYDDVSGVVGTPQTLGSKTYVNGLLDAADITYSAMTGNSVEALITYISTGSAATSRLHAYLDSGTNLPFTPNGGDVGIAWSASGIVQH